jgi:hypothetical protein
VYVALFVVGAILAFGGGQPDTSGPQEKVREYYADGGHRDRITLGWILVILGVFLFLWFLGSLRQTLRRLEGDGLLTGVATMGGVVYAALTVAGISVNFGIKTMSDDTFRHTVYPELIHAADDTWYVLHATGGIGAGAMIIAASLIALRARAVPAWLGLGGVVAGILALASIAFFPQFLIALWLGVVGILLFLARPAASTP